MACASCARQTSLVFAADGQPVDFDAALPPHRLLAWMAAARRAMASGMPGVAVGSCSSCNMPLVISSKQPVTLPCPHCKNVVQGPAEKVLVDQWPEPWCKVETGGLSLEYRVAWVDDSTAITAGCAGCGAPTAADDPATRCPRCQSVTWIEREIEDEHTKETTNRRMQLGVRVNGMRQDRPYNVILSLPQGEATLRTDNVMGSSASSSSSLLGVTGIGCALAIAGCVLFGLIIAILVHFSS
jgi:phage FluMu protein Com